MPWVGHISSSSGGAGVGTVTKEGSKTVVSDS